jgi:hypothetical protein
MTSSKLSTGALIAAGAGLVLFLSLFVDWVGDFSAWRLFDVVDIVLAVLGLVPVALAAARISGTAINLPVDAGRLVLVFGIIATTIVATFVLEGDELKFGIFLSLIAGVGPIYGGTQMSREGTVAPAAPAAPTTPQAGPPPTL